MNSKVLTTNTIARRLSKIPAKGDSFPAEILFDDAFEIDKGKRVVNSYVKDLIDAVDTAAR